MDKYGFLKIGKETWLILADVNTMRRLYVRGAGCGLKIDRFYYDKSLEGEMRNNGLFDAIIPCVDQHGHVAGIDPL